MANGFNINALLAAKKAAEQETPATTPAQPATIKTLANLQPAPKPVVMPKAIGTDDNIFASIMAKASEVSEKAKEVINPQDDEAMASLNHDDLRNKIGMIMTMQEQNHPGIVHLLNDIHRVVVARHDLVAILTDDEIGQIVSGLASVQNVVIAKEVAKKASGRKKLSNVSLDDI